MIKLLNRCTIGRTKHVSSNTSIGKQTTIAHKSLSTMDSIADVDIDNSGKFKYVLIKVSDATTDGHKYIVRGYAWAAYHGDIMDSVEPQLAANKVVFDCVGGGRIIHKPEERTIKVFGYSQGFGKADHSITCSLLKQHYPNYASIDWSDDGY